MMDSEKRDKGPVVAREPRLVMRGSERVRVYRRPEERRALVAGFGLITICVALPLARAVLEHPVPTAGLPFLALFLCIPAAGFWWAQRLGVYVSKNGVKNVGLSRVTFTEWTNIKRFVVDIYTPLSSCVQAEHPDGSRTPLTALARWTRRREDLIPYCERLNSELATRATG